MEGRKALRCGAKIGENRICVAKAMSNGRCRNHGGRSKRPGTMKVRIKSLANLKEPKKKEKLLSGD